MELSQFAIKSALSSFWDGTEVLLYDEVESTNNLAKQELSAGGKYLIAAAAQTRGRGRRERSFYSPAGGLYFSLAFPWGKKETPVLVTTMAAVATARVLERTFAIEIGIKWVNDLFYQGRKVCGILTEAIREPESGQNISLVLGIGVNLLPPEEGFPEDIAEIAGAVTDGSLSINRNALIVDITNEIGEIISQLPERTYLEDYRKRCFIIGREVVLDTGKHILVEDISDNGSLLYFEGGKLQEISSGEISLKEY